MPKKSSGLSRNRSQVTFIVFSPLWILSSCIHLNHSSSHTLDGSMLTEHAWTLGSETLDSYNIFSFFKGFINGWAPGKLAGCTHIVLPPCLPQAHEGNFFVMNELNKKIFAHLWKVIAFLLKPLMNPLFFTPNLVRKQVNIDHEQ